MKRTLRSQHDSLRSFAGTSVLRIHGNFTGLMVKRWRREHDKSCSVSGREVKVGNTTHYTIGLLPSLLPRSDPLVLQSGRLSRSTIMMWRSNSEGSFLVRSSSLPSATGPWLAHSADPPSSLPPCSSSVEQYVDCVMPPGVGYDHRIQVKVSPGLVWPQLLTSLE